MINMRKLMASLLSLLAGACALSMSVRADDIDIFLGNQTNITVNAPNIIFVIDNTDNWSAANQFWPDAPTQGQAEVAAISTELKAIKASMPANVGLVLLSSNAGTPATEASGAGNATKQVGGAYVRFAVRDMTVAANKTALQNILGGPTTLGGIYNNIRDSNEKMTGQSTKDEGAAFYEIYKYLSGLAPYTGTYSAFSPPAAQNQYVDVAGNLGPSLDRLTGAGQGLLSGFAINGGVYQSPLNTGNPCAATYIIYVANNTSKTPSQGLHSYEPLVNVSPGLAPTAGLDTTLDEWTHFLNTNGVQVPSGNNNGAVVTYVLDAYNKQNNAAYSNSLIAAAKQGGGKYFQVSSQAQISNALGTIFSEIQAVNSTFASASLPVNTTNRSQNLNQVFIPMFRPDAQSRPLWVGNLKEYQVVNILGSIELGDNSSPPINAVNLNTGFVTPCAQSFWTTDSGTYWQSDIFDPLAKGSCRSGATIIGKFSDAPDGPVVEKGGVAEVIRKGNPPTTSPTPNWRTIYTLNDLTSTSLTAFRSTTLGGTNQALANFIMGQDVNDENANGNITEARPSVHGDEVHSRPTPVDYGANGVVVYYGSNDGMLRAINASTGGELWAFVAPEFYTSNTPFTRLMSDSPQISYPNMPTGITPTPIPKDYYFDGNIGQYQTANNSSVWIFPTMRRGGRTVYAFDVTTPASPSVKWKIGCPYPQGNDTGCTSGMSATAGTSGIGQTWSTPVVATSVLGHTGPVIIMGGGYDTCEDANTATPTCTSPQGAAVYVIDANTGAIIKTFNTTRSVVGDVALIAVANAAVVDHAYAADTGGSVYRIDFASSVSNWVINQVAYTTGSGRKFLYAPALLAASGGHVYVALGSGDREHPLQSEYPYGGVTNRFYVYLDNLGSTSATNLDGSTLYDYTILPGGSVGSTTSCDTPGVLPGGTMKGWFINLNQYGTGEQTVSSALIAGGAVAFSTNRPIPVTPGTCANLGQALGYWVNLFNASGAIGVPGATCGGARASMFTGGGLPPSPVLANVVVNGVSITVTFGTSQLGGALGAPIGGQSPPPLQSPILGTAGSPLSPNQVNPAIVPVRKKLYWKSSGEN